MVGEKYIAAVRDGSGATPLLIPALANPIPPEELIASVDGFLFTGSLSNVAPKHYGGTAPREGVLQDERRDDTTLPLLKAAIAAGKPVLCVCRGIQELNVAFGGTLHQHVQEVPGRRDHRENNDAPLEEQYGPAHTISVQPGGLLADILGAGIFQVNSLHGQGIDRLADKLHAGRRCARWHDRSGVDAGRGVIFSACNGIPNGAGRRTRSPARSSSLSARR